MTCRGKGQWQKAKEVCHQDEHEHCHDVWEVNDTVFAGHIFNHFIHQAIGQFGNRLATCRHQGPTTRAKYQKRNNGQDCETHPKGHIGDCKPFYGATTKQWCDLELIHRMKYEAGFCFAMCFCCQGLNPLFRLRLAPCACFELPGPCASSSAHRPQSPNL